MPSLGGGKTEREIITLETAFLEFRNDALNAARVYKALLMRMGVVRIDE